MIFFGAKTRLARAIPIRTVLGAWCHIWTRAAACFGSAPLGAAFALESVKFGVQILFYQEVDVVILFFVG
jgi:hypothetical protein